MSSFCAVGIPEGMTAMVALARSNVALTRVSEVSLPVKLDSPVGTGGCCSRIGQRRRPALLLLHKRGPLLATAQESGEVDIVRITRNKDGSQLFTFGPVKDNGQVKQSPPPTAQAEPAQEEPPPPAPRSRSSGFKKGSSVTKRPARTSVPSSNPSDGSSPETSPRNRPQSGFAKRSPIPHSSDRTPVSRATNTPVAVSPTVTPARGSVSRPSTNAPLTGVRERTEAPIPTQDRLRPKSQFKRRSPIAMGVRKSRPTAPDKRDEQPSTSAASVGSARPRSTFSKPSPVVGKNARALEGVTERTEQQGAVSGARPSRPSSSFKKPALALGRSPRGTPGPRAPGKAEADGDGQLKRPGTAFRKASPISSAGRAARQPGLRAVQDLTGIATNGVAKAAQKVEDVIQDFVANVSGGNETGTESEDESDYEGPSGESDLYKMKLKELRQLAKERKIKGMWTMKKAELIGALEVSFSEDV